MEALEQASKEDVQGQVGCSYEQPGLVDGCPDIQYGVGIE